MGTNLNFSKFDVRIKIFPNKEIPIDVGFMVFNKITYPNLINFFKENEIEIEESDMSFSVTVKGTNIEYCGKGLNGIFSNRGNLFNTKFTHSALKFVFNKNYLLFFLDHWAMSNILPLSSCL